MSDLQAVRQRIVALWGGSLTKPAGVLHVTAVGRLEGNGLGVLRIGPGSPASETDSFALAVARARCDAIVTTGSILRAEADVSHDPGPDLLAWRTDVLGKAEAPLLAVLTRGTNLPAGHPALDRPSVLLGTGLEGAAGLEARVGSRAAVIGLETCSLRGLIRELRRRGHESLCVEAGPSTATQLYEEPLAVDELMLSVYEAGRVTESQVAGGFLAETDLRARLGHPASEVSHKEASGLWRFRRYVRSPNDEAVDEGASR